MLQETDRFFLEQQKLQFIDIIGRGGYGSIFLVHSEQYHQNFALKKVPTKSFRQSEIDCMRTIDNPTIVPLYNYYYFNEYVYMLMEFCPSSLDRELKEKGQMMGPTLIRTTIGILKAIKCCHDNKISHNDIKPSNFLIDAYQRIKVCDFGLSSFIEGDSLSSLFAGSLTFIAPEVLLKKPFDPFKADIWSMGVTFYALATAHIPWNLKSEQTLIESIATAKFDLSRVPDHDYALLISRCLRLDPLQRPTVHELLETPLLSEEVAPKVQFLKTSKTGIQTHSLIRLNRLIVRPFAKQPNSPSGLHSRTGSGLLNVQTD